jgi:Ni,Fe-hydrogenase I small subunit
MNQLYEVKTDKYKTYFVMAQGFDNAKEKVEDSIIENNTDNILKSDGSLNKEYENENIKEIKLLGSKLII